MGLVDMLRSAQNGEFFANAGRVAGVDAAAAERTLGKIGPAIAAQLRKRAEDPDAFETLLDLLEDGNGAAFLDDPNFMDDPELISDGEAVLAELYGSTEAAGKALVIRPNDAPAHKLAAIAASGVLAALARTYKQPLGLVGARQAAGGDPAQGGILSTIISALIKGVMQAVMRQLMPRRRRRSPSGYFGTRKKRTTRRRRSTPSLDQIFREILGPNRS